MNAPIVMTMQILVIVLEDFDTSYAWRLDYKTIIMTDVNYYSNIWETNKERTLLHWSMQNRVAPLLSWVSGEQIHCNDYANTSMVVVLYDI